MVEYDPIGYVRSPYETDAPYQPQPDDAAFAVELEPEYADGPDGLASFSYAYVLFDLHRVEEYDLSITPPWREDDSLGVFATRAPDRPNGIGLSVVRILDVEDGRIDISAIDAFDGTPVLDIKPYVDGLDTKDDADVGWIDLDDADDADHLELHLEGIVH
ncbi:tRNA (N6-threonylcarbamoyladenosine(37)-N6)-methyltransferase TrmO [Halorhabdus salina]|uniref:tRNA (N6-threonylcarbamoyladenosine(37)-N6)-methyltransferase TrmO n=1 Tax=Halorhabdus salina TaxID=2750670 RepID=UPI0015EE9D4E|nr:tRNA (N6-threonylcarbamoyladenosine(37)-N6)-methyltransferase TrmO [Halorhabdus salina]